MILVKDRSMGSTINLEGALFRKVGTFPSLFCFPFCKMSGKKIVKGESY